MPSRITATIEFVLGTLTFISTFITGEFVIDLIVGIITYTSARLFYIYFGSRIRGFIDRMKSKFKKSKK